MFNEKIKFIAGFKTTIIKKNMQKVTVTSRKRAAYFTGLETK